VHGLWLWEPKSHPRSKLNLKAAQSGFFFDCPRIWSCGLLIFRKVKVKKILLLINPHARTGDGIFEEINEAILSEGHELIQLSAQELQEDFNTIIKRYSPSIDLVVIGGGDGTVNYLLPSLMETKLPFIVYPLGTANLLAKSFNIEGKLNSLLDLIDHGNTVTVDLGKVNGKLFINVAGLGISTEVNKKLPSNLKKFTGKFSFWIMGFKLRKSLRPFKINLSADDKLPIFTKTWQITVCNGRTYGNWMTIHPDAAYDDNTLYCLSTEVKRWWEGIRLLPSYLRGDYRELHEVTFLKGKKIKIESKKPLNIDVDGDVQTCTPALFEVVPQAVRMVIPTEIQEDIPLRSPPPERVLANKSLGT
jgi:diacylglycerol kinase (ATP)